MDIEKAMNQGEEEYNAGKSYQTNYFNLEEDGTYQVRVISGFAPMGTHWLNKKPSICFGTRRGCKICVEVEKDGAEINGRQDIDEDEKRKMIYKLPSASVRFVCNLIDRKDGEVKLAKLPYSVAKKINEWHKDPEYPFNENDSPNFDIKIVKETKNKKTAYTTDLVPSTLDKNITEEEEEEKLASSDNDPERFVTAMKKKSAKDAGIDVEKIDWSDKKKKKGEEDLPVIQVDESVKNDEIDVESIPF